jgi:crotonobetainyl-CoA:carnitine CoA-transferase CaiB-like acyl-CoA transferase
MTSAYDGLRVVDFTHVLAGPLCTRFLADHGADVIKIEPPGGDVIRRLPYPVGADSSTQFAQYNCGKRSVCLDLKDPEALEVARSLALRADVVIENFSRGTLTRLGLDLGELRVAAPGLVTCSISAFGTYGPYAGKAGFGYVAEAHSGLMHLNGDGDEPPSHFGTALSDMNVATHAFGALGAALFHRARTGEGTHVDLSAFDCMVALIDHAIAIHNFTRGERHFDRYGTRHPFIVPQGVVRAADGRYVTFGAIDDGAFARLAEAMGAPELASDPRYSHAAERIARREEVYAIVETWAATVPSADVLVDRLSEHRIPAARIRTHVEVADDPHLVARGTLAPVDYPGTGTVLTQTAPHPMEGLEVAPRGPAPGLGEHTRAVLRDELGMSSEQVDTLVSRGAARVPQTQTVGS